MSMPNCRVGIVMLLYNRSDVAVACLRSLAAAKTDVPWELYLLDNASKVAESDLVKAEFDRLELEGGIKGQFIRSDINHGFPGGNNLGISYFMERDDISHICLLNSDVIVTDYWLDRLLDKNADAIGPVTNACGNEQTIPVPFNIGQEDDVFGIVNDWAQKRYAGFQGYLKQTDFLGFYCFLARIELFLTVGLLDERFGQGAYEDDDYCVRILSEGYQMVVARDVFIYHWGTASFSKIPSERLVRLLESNRQKFEDKHDIHWKDRSLLPLQGVIDDLEFDANKRGDENFSVTKSFAVKCMESVGSVLADKGRQLAGNSTSPRWLHNLRNKPTMTPLERLGELFALLVRRKPILVFGRFYPTDEDMKDGYFQRVRFIDDKLNDHCRIYVRYENAELMTGFLPAISKKKARTYEFVVRKNSVVHCACALLLGVICRRVYVHSVLRFSDRITRLLYSLASKRVFDVHGVVPEEFGYEGDEDNSRQFGEFERWAVERATALVTVTRAMADHLSGKYGDKPRQKRIYLSILPRTGAWRIDETVDRSRNGVIYSGGLHKWQQVDKMLEYVHANAERYSFTFLVTRPDEVKLRYRNSFGKEFPGIVTSALPHEMAQWYKKNAYGLVLREDVVVNRVACPTKLVEYLQYGLVPIVDCAQIGDFCSYGYQYIQMNSKLPDDNSRIEMQRSNYAVMRKLSNQFINGLSELTGFFQGE